MNKTNMDDQNSMIKSLNSQVQNHRKERMMLIEMNEDLEKDIIEKEKVINQMKKGLRKATDRVKVFEDEFEIEYDETIKIRDRAELYKAQTMEYQKRLERAEFLLNNMEKKREISGKVIETLQNDNKDLKKKLEDTVESKSKSIDVDKLIEEIELIKKSNQEKESFLVDIEQEKEMLKQNLFEVEKANEVLKEQLEHKEQETEHVQNLSDELGIRDLRVHNVSPECDPCDMNSTKAEHLQSHDELFHARILVKKIWKLKEIQLEQTINSQKLRLTSDILYIKKNKKK